jgi:hypothetical protein
MMNLFETGKKSPSALRQLCETWKFNKEFIEEIFLYFGNSYDETDYFLDLLDGSDNLEEAWEKYKDERDVIDECPFKNLTI